MHEIVFWMQFWEVVIKSKDVYKNWICISHKTGHNELELENSRTLTLFLTVETRNTTEVLGGFFLPEEWNTILQKRWGYEYTSSKKSL